MHKTAPVTDPLYPGAQKATDWKDWPEGASRVIVEPKLDGFRLSAVVDADGVISFHCGKATPPDWAENLEHIAAAVRATGVRSAMIDGEITAATWNETAKLIKRHRSKMSDAMKVRIEREVRFHAFDCVPLDVAREDMRKPGGRKMVSAVPVPLSERYGMLSELVARAGRSELQLVPQFTAYSAVQVFEIFDEMVEFEFEGAMVKVPESPYMFDRVSCWQKLKPMQTLELTVVGAIVGKGKHKGRLGALECLTEGGAKVNCGVGFTDETRERLWYTWQHHPENLIGKVIEVKCQAGNVATVRHGNFLRFRGDDNASAAQ